MKIVKIGLLTLVASAVAVEAKRAGPKKKCIKTDAMKNLRGIWPRCGCTDGELADFTRTVPSCPANAWGWFYKCTRSRLVDSNDQHEDLCADGSKATAYCKEQTGTENLVDWINQPCSNGAEVDFRSCKCPKSHKRWTDHLGDGLCQVRCIAERVAPEGKCTSFGVTASDEGVWPKFCSCTGSDHALADDFTRSPICLNGNGVDRNSCQCPEGHKRWSGRLENGQCVVRCIVE